VIEYVKTATEAGKSQKQIMTELAAKGVTRAQAERIKRRYEGQQSAG
jgi:SOS response regulatory protein OraA/RecX